MKVNNLMFNKKLKESPNFKLIKVINYIFNDYRKVGLSKDYTDRISRLRIFELYLEYAYIKSNAKKWSFILKTLVATLIVSLLYAFYQVFSKYASIINDYIRINKSTPNYINISFILLIIFIALGFVILWSVLNRYRIYYARLTFLKCLIEDKELFNNESEFKRDF